MRRRQQPPDLPDPRPSLIDGQQGRFTKKKPNWASYRRWKIGNYHHGQAGLCRAAGDEVGYERHMAVSKAASAGTLRLERGPAVVPIASKQPPPPKSPEES